MNHLNSITSHKTEKRRKLLKRYFHTASNYPITDVQKRMFSSFYSSPELNSILNGYGIPSSICAVLSKDQKIKAILNDSDLFSLLEKRNYSPRSSAEVRRLFRFDLKAIGSTINLYHFLTSHCSMRLEPYFNDESSGGRFELIALKKNQPEISDPERYLGIPIDFNPGKISPKTPAAPAPSEPPNENPASQEPVIKEAKIPTGADPMSSMIASAIVPLVRDALRSEDDALTESKVLDMISTEIGARMPFLIQPSTPPNEEPPAPDVAHEAFPQIFKAIQCNLNVMLIGPAGSGKTSIAEQIAKALKIPFRFTGAVDSPYKLTGFIDANGNLVRTAFREAYENGGLFLFDEVDASSASAMMAFNAALANGSSDFPDGVIKRHKDFRCIAAANTFGRGADRIYVGRNALDGATLDRFVVVNFEYDETLERALAGEGMADWVNRVQEIRKAVFNLKLRFVVSPRASIFGSQLLRSGMSKKETEEMVIWKGMEKETRKKIRAEIS